MVKAVAGWERSKANLIPHRASSPRPFQLLRARSPCVHSPPRDGNIRKFSVPAKAARLTTSSVSDITGSDMNDNASDFLPLSPAALHILLSLAGEDLHGYGIMQEVARQSGGKYRIGPGTLYDNLQKMIARRWVEEPGARPGDDDPRRRYYRLTSLGRGILREETARLAEVVREARIRLQAAKPRRA